MDEWTEKVEGLRGWNKKNDEIQHKDGKDNFLKIWENE